MRVVAGKVAAVTIAALGVKDQTDQVAAEDANNRQIWKIC